MSVTGGERAPYNLFNHIKPENLTIIKTVRRFGYPFANTLSLLIPDMEVDCKHTTEFTHLKPEKFEAD